MQSSLQDKPPSPFLAVDDMKPGERKRNLVRVYDPKDDDDVLKMEPEIQPRPRLVCELTHNCCFFILVTLVIKGTFYLQKYEAPKVTFGILF